MIFKTNEVKYPALGSTTMCELCGVHDKPNEYHYICKCTGLQRKLDKTRHAGLLRLLGQIRNHNASNMQPPYNFMYSVMFPDRPEDYTFGLVPMKVKTWLTMPEGTVTTADIRKIQHNIQVWTTNMYKDIWKECKAQLHMSGITLEARLKSKYGINTTGMTLHAPFIDSHADHARHDERIPQHDDHHVVHTSSSQ